MSMDVCDIGFRSPDWHQETFADSSPARSSRACEARSSQWICSQCMRVEAKGYIDLQVSTVSSGMSYSRDGFETWAEGWFGGKFMLKMMESELFMSVLRTSNKK